MKKSGKYRIICPRLREAIISKYDSLRRYLLDLSPNEWVASFGEVERVLGFRLPDSARRFPAWWANQEPPHSQTHGWHAAGWKTSDLDLVKERVTFRRTKLRSTSTQRGAGISRTSTSVVTASPPAPIFRLDDQTDHVDIRAQFTWQHVGYVEIDERGKLVFPASPIRAGLYRFRVLSAGREARYVGETDNIHRRFVHYRMPGPTQETNLRINARLIGAIESGARIAVAIVTEGLLANETGRFIAADLTKRSSRRFLENGALAIGTGVDIEILNLG